MKSLKRVVNVAGTSEVDELPAVGVVLSACGAGRDASGREVKRDGLGTETDEHEAEEVVELGSCATTVGA